MWQDIVRDATRQRDASIDAVQPSIAINISADSHNVIQIPRQILTQEEIRITDMTLKSLVKEIADGKLTAVAVTNAFLRRAALAQKLVNCIFELLPDEAITRAKALDEAYKQEGPVGPLHGIPISLKASINLKNHRKGGGFVKDYEGVADDSADIVKILWKAGAVFHARTTEPQALMMLETSSNLTGITSNPHNLLTTCGGSTGGEAALQALRGSLLGIGSDIGGSVRSPAGNCGTYALKPTTRRLPSRGSTWHMLNNEAIIGTYGPMSTDLDGINLLMRAILNSSPWKDDLNLHQLPWWDTATEPTLGKRRLTIGVMWDDGVVKPTAPVTRALTELVQRLSDVPGFSTVNWQAHKHEHGIRILEKLYSPDGGRATKDACQQTGEPLHDLISYRLTNGPGVEQLSIHDLWQWVGEREAYRQEYLQQWNSKAPQMDIILCPYLPTPAPLIESTRYWGYTSIWNLLDYPAVVFPVAEMDPEVDVEPAHEPRNEADQWCREHYDPIKQKGTPISLQLVGKRMEDEALINALEMITSATGLPFVDCLAASNPS